MTCDSLLLETDQKADVIGTARGQCSVIVIKGTIIYIIKKVLDTYSRFQQEIAGSKRMARIEIPQGIFRCVSIRSRITFPLDTSVKIHVQLILIPSMRPHSRYRTTMLNGLIQRLILIYVFSIHETIATIQGKARSQITIEGHVNTFDLRFIDIRTHLYLIIVRTMGGVISIPFRRIQHLIVNHATYVIHKSGHGQREIPHRIFCAQRKIVALLRVQIRITDRKAGLAQGKSVWGYLYSNEEVLSVCEKVGISPGFFSIDTGAGKHTYLLQESGKTINVDAKIKQLNDINWIEIGYKEGDTFSVYGKEYAIDSSGHINVSAEDEFTSTEIKYPSRSI